MADDKNNIEVQKRNQEISRLKRLNQSLRNKSQSQQKNKLLEKEPEDSILFGLFDMFKFG